ncbi:MAG TPA: glycosyltransferase family 1 protein [Dehalococcoidia bacterium]
MARSLRPPLTGIGRYTANLAGALSELPEVDISLFLTRDADVNGLRCERVTAPIATPHEALRGLWEQTLVPFQVARGGFDVYHSPNYTLPIALSRPGVLTIHDLAFLDSRFHTLRLRTYLRLLLSAAMTRAQQVITVSRHTQTQLEKRFPAAIGKTTTIYPGLDPLFSQQPGTGAVREFRERRGLDSPYVLFVGTIEPRKNVRRLIRAFERAMSDTGLPHRLVLCGHWGWRYGAAEKALAASPVRDRITVTGYVPAEELPLYYAGADALLYPSLHEGFGFPPLEAMALGTPVVTSNSTSLPEVVGDAAVSVRPESVTDIAAGLVQVLTSQPLADDLRERGPGRAGQFSWQAAAQQTLDVYTAAVGGRP